jgi:hypothetical protein
VALCGVGVAGLIGLACATDHLSRVRVESAADALAR